MLHFFKNQILKIWFNLHICWTLLTLTPEIIAFCLFLEKEGWPDFKRNALREKVAKNVFQNEPD